LQQTQTITESTQHMAADMLRHSHDITTHLLKQLQQQTATIQRHVADSPSLLNRQLSASDLLELDPLFASDVPALSNVDMLTGTDQLTLTPDQVTLQPPLSVDSPKFSRRPLVSADSQSLAGRPCPQVLAKTLPQTVGSAGQPRAIEATMPTTDTKLHYSHAHTAAYAATVVSAGPIASLTHPLPATMGNVGVPVFTSPALPVGLPPVVVAPVAVPGTETVMQSEDPPLKQPVTHMVSNVGLTGPVNDTLSVAPAPVTAKADPSPQAVPYVVIKQHMPVKPYAGTTSMTSWKSFRDHFIRVCAISGWYTIKRESNI